MCLSGSHSVSHRSVGFLLFPILNRSSNKMSYNLEHKRIPPTTSDTGTILISISSSRPPYRILPCFNVSLIQTFSVIYVVIRVARPDADKESVSLSNNTIYRFRKCCCNIVTERSLQMTVPSNRNAKKGFSYQKRLGFLFRRILKINTSWHVISKVSRCLLVYNETALGMTSWSPGEST